MARTVEECEAMLRILAPGYVPMELASPAEISIGVAWLEGADALVRERVAGVAAFFPHRRDLELPFPDVDAAFMREVADVHRDLYAEYGDLYGNDIALKIERCLEVAEAEAEAARRRRNEYRRQVETLTADLDLVLTPTTPVVAPPVEIGDLTLRSILTRNTLPINALGWPALALPCGPAEDGLPASVQLVGKPGRDDLVLAAGKLLASLV
jgi:Asp-tRNA(Asn)/Glu-tRNA(Gln) amidotransferase A subunit family amidase